MVTRAPDPASACRADSPANPPPMIRTSGPSAARRLDRMALPSGWRCTRPCPRLTAQNETRRIAGNWPAPQWRWPLRSPGEILDLLDQRDPLGVGRRHGRDVQGGDTGFLHRRDPLGDEGLRPDEGDVLE